MRALALLLLLSGCAHVGSAQSWCEHFCGDRVARASEMSEHGTAIAVCTCHSPVQEQFDAAVEARR